MHTLRLALSVVIASIAIAPAAAGDLTWLFNGVSSVKRAAHRVPPATCGDPQMDRVTAEIEWLKHFLDRYGSIVAKQPDVWGQSRLTRHRQEYEDELRGRLGEFEVRANAAIRRSDQAFLGMAMALEAATDRKRGPELTPVPEITSNTNVISAIGSLLPTTNEQVDRPGQAVVARTAPFAIPQAPPGMQFEAAPISLEPTIQLDQLSRYLNHLHELRRINEGDDIADSPGYSLNLVRIPISVTPGKLTRKGHGAEVSVSVKPVLGEDLLPNTFRSLVINDLVDVIAPALTWCVNDRACIEWASTIVVASRQGDGPAFEPAPNDAPHVLPAPGEVAFPEGDPGVDAAVRSLAARIPSSTRSTAPSVKSRRARMPIPFSQLVDTAGVREIAFLIHDTRTALDNHPTTRPCIAYVEVRNHLTEELKAAYDFLVQERQQPIWLELPQWNLAEAVRSRRVHDLDRLRGSYFAAVGPDAWQTSTAVLGWAILLESALLNERLAEDVRDSATSRGYGAAIACRGPFYGPNPSPESRAAFNEYVCRRWPIRVFALDPVSQEQNVEDAFARRRELQIAAAMAFASGRMSAQGLMRFTRRLETDMATISLNKTAVGFTHGHDTFGWRFHPRVQTPPTRHTLAAFTETVCGGPSAEAELLQRQLEPGQRECTAIIVMPAFVPFLTFHVQSQWFSLPHPADTKPTAGEAMTFSRSVRAIEEGVAHCQHHATLYRPGDLELLMEKVTQLDRRLPMQLMQAQIPYENTAGGFELFNTGITDLAPEIIGWYGSSGIDPDRSTSVYLIGKGFSVHDTSVIAGGRKVPITLVSREVLEATIPPGVRTIRQDCGPDGACGTCNEDCNGREVVDIHLATPYGVSSHLFVPVFRDRGDAAGPTSLAFDEGYRLGLSFMVTKATGTKTEAAKLDEFYSTDSDTIMIRVPDSFVPPAKAELACTLTDTATGQIAATFGAEGLPFDARRGGYRIGGNDLRNFIGDTSRPATDKTLRGAVKPYLDAQLARGQLAGDGDTVSLRLTAALVAEQQEVPIDGWITIEATRRGKATLVEPPQDP